MCFGNNNPPSAPQLAAPPPAPEILDFIDEISGTQTITVVGEDGKKRRVTQKLPLTPEEEQRLRAGQELMRTSLENIKQLYRYDPASMVSYAPFIETFANLNRERQEALGQIADIGNIAQDVDDFRQMQRTIMDEEFSANRKMTEENLAHAGRSGGSFANDLRARLAKQEALGRQQGEVNALNYGEDLSARRLDKNARAFGLQEIGRGARLDQAQTGYALAKEHEADIERRRQNAIAENQGLLGIGQNIVGSELNKNQGGKTAELANQTFQMQANDSLARYNAGVNAQMANYKMQMDQYNATPPTFGESLAKTGFQLAGRAIGGLGGGQVGTQMANNMYKPRQQPGVMYGGR